MVNMLSVLVVRYLEDMIKIRRREKKYGELI